MSEAASDETIVHALVRLKILDPEDARAAGFKISKTTARCFSYGRGSDTVEPFGAVWKRLSVQQRISIIDLLSPKQESDSEAERNSVRDGEDSNSVVDATQLA